MEKNLDFYKNKAASLEDKLFKLKSCYEFVEPFQAKQLYLLIAAENYVIHESYLSDNSVPLSEFIKPNTKIIDLFSSEEAKSHFIERFNKSRSLKSTTIFQLPTVTSQEAVITVFGNSDKSKNLIKMVLIPEEETMEELPDDINYKNIAEYAADAFLLGNNKGEMTGINKSFTRLTGYTFQDIKNKHIAHIFSDASLNKRPLQFSALDAGETIMNERQLIAKKGELIDIEMHTRRIDHLRYFTIIRDIRQRKAMQIALSENQARFNKLFSNSPLGILFCGKGGDIYEINQAFLDILESPSLEFTKKINLLTFPPLRENGFADALEKSVETGQTLVQQFEYTSKWGRHSYVKSYFIPLKNNENTVTGAFVIAEDISKQHYYIEELKKAKDKALESERLKSAFLANISHEIRTPLNAVLGFAQLFDCNEYSNEELMRFKSSIIKGSNSLLNLIEGIIKLSELQSGNISIKNEKISIDLLLENLVKYGKQEIQNVNKDIRLLYEYSSLERFIHSDELLLERVMKHLINNAVKFTDSGYIKIGIYAKNSSIVFFVQDSGIGISDKQIKYIFDKFRQAESPEADIYRGVGMGLALSKEIISKLQGKISVHSEIGKGSTFEVVLPKQINQDYGDKNNGS